MTEQQAHTLTIPAPAFCVRTEMSPKFRQLIFEAACDMCIGEFVNLLENVTFDRIESLVASRLHEHGHTHDPVPISHRKLAYVIGTAREVASISRNIAGSRWRENAFPRPTPMR